jgi:ectoine hydroxylase-related dioxygenase (phytanoyl-CoA dioxygenase family)
MILTDEQVKNYEKSGFLFLPACLTGSEIELMQRQLPALFREESPARILEKDGTTVRSVYGCHTKNDVFKHLGNDSRLATPAIQLLKSDVYIYQFKVNVKAAFAGDVWEWHQDYIFWRNEDGMLAPHVINVVVFLDEVNEFNGPLLFIPGTHIGETVDIHGNVEQPDGYKHNPAWVSSLTADLKYSLDRTTVAQMVSRHEIIAPKGPAGSLLFFHGNIAHASAQNISPSDRKLILITYNSVENMPVSQTQRRP